MNLIIDPEFKNLLVPLLAEERSELEASLIESGCLDSLKVWDGILVDGHNRYSICSEFEISFQTREMAFATRDEAKIWILENQLARRNLNNFQRAEIALQLKGVFAGQAKEKQKEAGGAVRQKSDKAVIDTKKELAKSAGVSHDTIHKVEVVLDKGTPEIQEAVRTGDISINNAYHETVQSTLPPKRPSKPLQFEDVIRKVAKLLDEATAGLDVLVENAELFHSEQYGKALESGNSVMLWSG